MRGIPPVPPLTRNPFLPTIHLLPSLHFSEINLKGSALWRGHGKWLESRSLFFSYLICILCVLDCRCSYNWRCHWNPATLKCNAPLACLLIRSRSQWTASDQRETNLQIIWPRRHHLLLIHPLSGCQDTQLPDERTLDGHAYRQHNVYHKNVIRLKAFADKLLRQMLRVRSVVLWRMWLHRQTGEITK